MDNKAKSKKSDLIIIASAKAKPGKEKELAQALLNVASPTRDQQGSVAFSLFRSKEDASVIVGLERWSTKEDHNRHLQGEHVKTLFAAMADVLAEPPVIASYDILDEVM